tara:strand:- start:393 stop:881 length:489 start_codon:yes stop_codon:yes gene_type:complete
MSNSQLHVVKSTADTLIVKHYKKLLELMRLGISTEHQLMAEKPNYNPEYTFPLNKEEKKLESDMAYWIQDGAAVFHTVDDVLVGVGFAYPIDDHKCMIGPLVVDEKHRRKGICKGMVHELENQMRDAGMKASVLVVLENNPAKDLYVAHGYGRESVILGREL